MSTIHTPFADELELETDNSQLESNGTFNNEQYAGYSPFSSAYESEATPEGEWESDPAAQQYFEILNELHDTEFESAIDNLVTELQEHLVSHEAATPFLNEAQSMQLANNYLQPIINETHQLFEAMAAELESLPLDQMNEMELEAAMDAVYLNRESNFTPAQEFFLKKFASKAKGIIGKVAKVAKKLSPTHLILKKMAPFIKPLVKRLLDKAMNKLPVSIRGIAIELANKLFKKKSEEPVAVEDGSDTAEQDAPVTDESGNESSNEEFFIGNEGEMPTSYPSQNIQAEFDHYISRLVNADNEMEQENILAEYERLAETEHENDIQNIEVAREQFINELENLKEGEDPSPALENFIPVIIKTAMKVLKVGIKIIGREKVVKFLAGLIAKWISKYIGEEKAMKLSMVVADKGLKLLKLETPEQEDNARQVYEAIANTVEEVATKISGLSEEVLSDPELLTHETYQAFESAAAAYFPDNTIKYEARESETGDGYWQSKGKYLKHTKVFETTLTLNQLKNVETFGGVNLAAFVTDSLGIKTNTPIKAKVHLYQAKKGSTLSGIALNEKNVPGLGTASRQSYNQLHVLDKKAASVLLGQPGLGKDVRPIRNRNRNLIFEGERFYYLQIQGSPAMQTATTNDSGMMSTVLQNSSSNSVNGAHVNQVNVTPTSRSTQLRRIISGSFNQGLVITDIIYFSENDSRKIQGALKQQSFGELYEYLKTLKPGFEKNFFGDKYKTGSIILKGLIEMAGKIIKENLSKTVLENIKQRVDEFDKAVNDPKQGVTVVIQYRISLARGKKLKLRLQEALSTVTISILPGFTQQASQVKGGNLPQFSSGQAANGMARQNGKTFYAAITPLNSNTFPVSKARFN